MENKYKKLLTDLTTIIDKEDASDLHISEGKFPIIRVHGTLIPIEVVTIENSRIAARCLIAPPSVAEIVYVSSPSAGHISLPGPPRAAGLAAPPA